MDEQDDIRKLNEKLLRIRGEDKVTIEKKQAEKQDTEARRGAQAGIELVIAVFLPTAIGYMIDDWLDTRPLFMLILFVLGICTGFYNVYRITQNIGTAVGNKKRDKDA